MSGLVRLADDSFRFRRSALRTPHRVYADRRREEGEREHEALHARHLAALGVTDPTRKTPPAFREALHVVPDESEEAMWRAWRALSVN